MSIERLSKTPTELRISAVSPIVKGVVMVGHHRSLNKPKLGRAHQTSDEEANTPGALPDTPYTLPPAELIAQGGLSPHEHGFQVGYQEGLRQGRELGTTSGHDEGFRQGLAQGLSEARQYARTEVEQEMQQAIEIQQTHLHEQNQRLSRMLSTWGEQQSAFQSKYADDMLALCFDAVGQIVGRLVQDPAQVIEMLRAVLQETGTASGLTVRLHPQDHALVQPLTVQITDKVRSDIHLEPDSRIQLGGLLVESDQGTLDARLETLMARFARFVLEQKALTTEAGHRD